MSLPMPKSVPEPGFYYHYKHDPQKAVNDYSYEVLGVGFHTEDDARPGEEHFVIYRPLYESSVYKAAKELGVSCFDARPLEMWMDQDTDYKEGRRGPRFSRITDPETIRALEEIRSKMY